MKIRRLLTGRINQRINCVAVSVFVFLAGCIKSDTTITLNSDGSGVLEASYEISEVAVNQIKAMNKLREQMSQINGPNESFALLHPIAVALFDPEESSLRRIFTKYSGNGIKIEKLRVDKRDQWRSVVLKLPFNNITNVAKADFYPDYGFSLIKRKDGNYLIKRRSEASGNRITGFLNTSANSKLLASVLSGFKVVVKVIVPSKVLDSNASTKGLYSAVWSFDYDKDVNAFTALQNQDFTVMFDGKTINLPQILFKGDKE